MSFPLPISLSLPLSLSLARDNTFVRSFVRSFCYRRIECSFTNVKRISEIKKGKKKEEGKVDREGRFYWNEQIHQRSVHSCLFRERDWSSLASERIILASECLHCVTYTITLSAVRGRVRLRMQMRVFPGMCEFMHAVAAAGRSYIQDTLATWPG